MSAIIEEKIILDVTRGDCVDANRKGGKSNTGTYFLCSIKDYYLFEKYFKEEYYFIDLKKLNHYCIVFNAMMKTQLPYYNGKGLKFKEYSIDLLNLKSNPKVNLTMRQNDNRIFIRFEDNTNAIVSSFRNLLYEDVSAIAIEIRKEGGFIYPVFKDVQNANQEDSLFVDE